MRLVASSSVTLILMCSHFKIEVILQASRRLKFLLLLLNSHTTKRLFVNHSTIIYFFISVVKHQEEIFQQTHSDSLLSSLQATTAPAAASVGSSPGFRWWTSPLLPHSASASPPSQFGAAERLSAGGSKCFLIGCFTLLDSLNGATGCDCSDGSA